MPSGAKKRKGAKKKKEKKPNNNTPSSLVSIDSNHHQGDDDIKFQDERESDVVESGSPVSEDHNEHQHPFDNSCSTIASTNGKPANEVADLSAGDLNVEVQNDAITEKNAKIDVESNHDNIQHATFPKESHDEVYRNFRSTDDDETPVPQRKLDEEAYGSVFNGHSTNNEDKIVDSLHKEVAQILEIEMPIENASSNLDVESSPNAGLGSPALPMSEVIKRELESVEVENTEALELVEDVLSQKQDILLHESIRVDSISVVEMEEDNPLFDEKCAVSSDAVISTVNANDGKILTLSGAHSVDPIGNCGNREGTRLKCISPSAEKDMVIPIPDENIEASLDSSSASLVADLSGFRAVEAIGTAGNNKALETCNTAANGNQITVLKSSVACTTETGNSVQVTDENETFDSSRCQPLIAPAPQVRTSWLNCCGLFEVFSGSSR